MITFNSVTMHNFGSYRHAEINLRNRGFCLVSGENRRKEDNALSNGSGKSMCWSAICFALTGETIQGVRTGLKNIYVDEDDAYVSLDFSVDKDHYHIKRILAPRSDLKLEKNDRDVSGKGIRESEAKLTAMLPDLNSDLLTSSILIGQGMPNKFSSFKPSGRKEILEKLTKSDFMITDMKNRIETRKEALSAKIAETSNRALIAKTRLQGINMQLSALKARQATVTKPDFDAILLADETKLAAIASKSDVAANALSATETKIAECNQKLLKLSNGKLTEKTALLEQYGKATAVARSKSTSLETELKIKKAELAKLKAHPDVCPTCGQKLPNSDHIKQERLEKENAISTLTEALSKVKADLAEKDAINKKYTLEIDSKYAGETKKLTEELQNAKKDVISHKSELNVLAKQAAAIKDEIIGVSAKRANWDKEQATLTEDIHKLEQSTEALEKEQADLADSLTNLDSHLAVVKQLENLTKRDFRGYILSDVIAYIDRRAKDFSEIIFKHRDLNVYLDANNLDISYNGKMLDNLSGGERQRVDLITQFALRDLLVNHMNMGSNILVLDEITDFLDKTSCDAVMNLVEKELNSVESVFIVSHHAESLGIAVDSELKIVKDASGVSEVVSG